MRKLQVLADIAKYTACDDCTGMRRSALIGGKPTYLATAHEHGQVRIYELTDKYVRQKAELRTKKQHDQELHLNYQMEVLRMAFSSDRDLAVLCRPRQPKSDPSPFAIKIKPEPRQVLKLVSGNRTYFRPAPSFLLCKHGAGRRSES